MLDFLKKNKKEKEAQAAREAAMEAERQRKEDWPNREQRLTNTQKAAKGFSVHWTILILKILKCWQNKRKAESVLKRSETMQR